MKKKKSVYTHRAETIRELTTQVKAMKRVLWAILEQEGGEYTIRPDHFEKAHEINAMFDAKINEDGSFSIFQTEYSVGTSGIESENFKNKIKPKLKGVK